MLLQIKEVLFHELYTHPRTDSVIIMFQIYIYVNGLQVMLFYVAETMNYNYKPPHQLPLLIMTLFDIYVDYNVNIYVHIM